MKIAKIKKLIGGKKFSKALALVELILAHNTESPYLWILRGDLIQILDAEDGPALEEAAKSYANALEMNPNDLEALEGLAHFYDAVDCKPRKAKKYAKAYLEKSKRSLLAMEKILSDEQGRILCKYK